MKILITGASGFVGSAVLRKLLDAGHEVRALVRKNSDRRNVSALTVELIEGDLGDSDSLRRAVSGCDRLYHVAADYRLWIPDPEKMYRINVQGTVDLMRRAAEAGVSRIIYTSSVAALGLNSDGTPADEETPNSLERVIGHYKRSKYLAEQAVLGLVRDEGLPVVTVNPSTPVGPRDVRPTPTGKMILDTLNGKMPAFVDTGLNIVHVDDVAQGHLLADEYGAIGEKYILGGEDMSLQSILQQISAMAGRRPPRIRIPHNLIIPVAWMMERIAGVSGKEPLATVDSIRMAKKKMYFSSARARERLRYQPRPAREGLADAVRWFREHGYSRD